MANKPSGENNGSAGPGYGGFGGSAGYSGSGAGGISGGYAGGGYSSGDYAGEPWRPAPDTHHDDRIHDDVCARLAASEDVDASAIEVSVEAGAVTLEGQVETRAMKHTARAIAELVPGVHRVHNRIHVGKSLMEAFKEKLSGA